MTITTCHRQVNKKEILIFSELQSGSFKQERLSVTSLQYVIIINCFYSPPQSVLRIVVSPISFNNATYIFADTMHFIQVFRIDRLDEVLNLNSKNMKKKIQFE